MVFFIVVEPEPEGALLNFSDLFVLVRVPWYGKPICKFHSGYHYFFAMNEFSFHFRIYLFNRNVVPINFCHALYSFKLKTSTGTSQLRLSSIRPDLKPLISSKSILLITRASTLG